MNISINFRQLALIHACWLGVVLGNLPAEGASLSRLRKSVFKIYTTSQESDPTSPWKKYAARRSTGTGFYIGDGRIMTNAHVVAEASFLNVQRDGDAAPEPAYVEFIAHDNDLALLRVKKEGYFRNVAPLRFGSLPELRSPVATIGFPTGGEQISITEGIVSRVGYRRYVHHGHAKHLLVQVDSAINPGNSGGPVLQGRKVVGVAFQAFTSAENTGYIIPTPVIRRFLKDIEDGTYDRHPELGIELSRWTVTNPSTAYFHAMEQEPRGVKVAHIPPWSPANGALLPGDIIIEVDQQPVGVDGKIEIQGERVDLRTVLDLKQIKDSSDLLVVRGGKEKRVRFAIDKARPHPRAGRTYARYPKFLVWGGLVFTTLSRSYLESWGNRWYKDAPLLLRYFEIYGQFEKMVSDRRDIIVLARKLPHAVNSYAKGNQYGVLDQVNGRAIIAMEQLAEIIDGADTPFMRFDFIDSRRPIVLDRRLASAANREINQQYGVHPDRWLKGPEIDAAIPWEGEK